MIRENVTKKKLKAGQAAIGAFMALSDPAVMEVLGRVGFDFVVIDNEHFSPDRSALVNILRAAELGGIQTTPLVRVREGTRVEVLNALDMGALGVQLPQMDTFEQARQGVEAAYYPPLGCRGLGTAQRSIGYGHLEKDRYFEMADREILTVVQCESLESVRNLDEILTIENLDVVFVGAMDLSCTMGKAVRGKRSHPELVKVFDEAIGKIVKSGKIAGAAAVGEEEVRGLMDRGVRYICAGLDLAYLRTEAQKSLAACRDVVHTWKRQP